jgi:uncharacterized protein (TIGR03435 family)
MVPSGRRFEIGKTSVRELISFAFRLQARQIAGAPAWVENDHYDIVIQAEDKGPGAKPWRTIVQTLLATRFGLRFHMEKQELSALALTAGKNGPKLAKSAADPQGPPRMTFGPLSFNAQNATMADFVNVLQSGVLDRPVIDQTGLTGKYDFKLTWTPDESQFGGLSGAPAAEDADAPPAFSTALQEQLGLALKSGKYLVDVMAIDQVEKPTGN